MSDESRLNQLAAELGIESRWHDRLGAVHEAPDSTVQALLRASGLKAESPSDIAELLSRRRQRFLEPVYVLRKSSLTAAKPDVLTLTVPEYLAEGSLRWSIEEEEGRTLEGACGLHDLAREQSAGVSSEGGVIRCSFPLPTDLNLGYHRLQVSLVYPSGVRSQSIDSAQTVVVVTPDRCFVPESLDGGRRIWGPSVRLATIKSRRNWGIGDFTDLKKLVDWCASQGGGLLRVDPLHAPCWWRQRGNQESGPSSRVFLNVLYIDVEAVADFAESEEVTRTVLSPAFQARLTGLRQAPLVDYEGVAAAKLLILRALYQHFCDSHLSKKTERERAFREFQRSRGSALEQFARFEAIRLWLQESDPQLRGWRSWPDPYRDPESEAVREFAEANREQVEFYQYLQWQADIQLQSVGIQCLNHQLPIGLVVGLSISSDPDGADVWQNQALYAREGRLGTPPDRLRPDGQRWGLAAILPACLREEAYCSFVDALRQTMRHAGAVSIRHIIGLKRLFWRPEGLGAAAAMPMTFRFEEMLGIAALESHRNRCLVVGEDLGTVTDSMRADSYAARIADQDWGVFGHKALSLEKENGHVYRAPATFPPNALVTFAADDLTNLTGYWHGHDLSWRSDSPFPMDKELRDQLVSERVMDRMDLLRLLEKELLLPDGVTTDPVSVPILSPELAASVYGLMARSPSALVAFHFEDVLGLPEHATTPSANFADYRAQKLAVELEDFAHTPGLELLVGQMIKDRGAYARFPLPDEELEEWQELGSRTPRATYRLQFSREFPLFAATELVPYLEKLGVTHCYASPLLRARPGSSHGYDIINHKQLNPEIGTEEGFNQFIAELRHHAMGLILDFVPNHMGIGKDNPWWMDVLENGQASVFAEYFDIDWTPVKHELWGKVLLPILGDSYGRSLMSGQIQLCFHADQGTLTLRCYDHELPLNPASYPIVLGHRLDVLLERLGKSNLDVMEYQGILAALERLPSDTEPIGFSERMREKQLHIRRLATLCQRNPDISEFVLQNVKAFQCASDNPLAADRLHSLLERQAYRLAYWRVAADEINYRRFFDVNDLAAVRVEDPRVFAEMHQLVLKLIAEQKLDGLRIDHPDGLFDPARYFMMLQGQAAHLSGLQGDQSAPGRRSDDASPPFYLVVEKILASFEHLDEDWPVNGTTGYDFLNSLNELLVKSDSEAAFNDIYEQFTGQHVSYDELKYQCKQIILQTVLSGELNVLAQQLNQISESSWFFRDYTLNSIRRALAEVVGYFPVYRTYMTVDTVDKSAKQYIEWAISLAKHHSVAGDTSIFDFIRKVLLMEPLDGVAEETNGDSQSKLQERIGLFAMKFQQFTGPVMAKSVEDTLFYRYNRFVCLNEVGGNPQRFGATINAFHHQNQERQRRHPYEMLATSTHDTKRSEDVRARLAVLSEIPSLWRQKITLWKGLNLPSKTTIDDAPAPSSNDEYLIYQTLVGACPADFSDPGILKSFSERIQQYMLKAVREAKVNSSWLNQNQGYENALQGFIEKILAPAPDHRPQNQFLEDLLEFQARLAEIGLINSLAQTLLKLTSPGVPDIYQGNELLDFSLVDPDNRRPVDFARRSTFLAQIEQLGPGAFADKSLPENVIRRQSYLAECLDQWADGRAKLFTTVQALDYRKRFPALFTRGRYIPLQTVGFGNQHVVAFAREHEREMAITAVPLRAATLLKLDDPDRFSQGSWHKELLSQKTWQDTAVLAPPELAGCKLQNLFTLDSIELPGQELKVSDLFNGYPVALLRVVRPVEKVVHRPG